jgi:hypothetical protein
MFFNKKKNKIEDTPEDKIRKKLQNDLYYQESILRNRVKNTLARIIAISVYPEGEDKTSAKNEAAEAQCSVLCEIGEYDLILRELKSYIENHVFVTTTRYPRNNERLATSHQIIKDVCMEFYKGN